MTISFRFLSVMSRAINADWAVKTAATKAQSPPSWTQENPILVGAGRLREFVAATSVARLFLFLGMLLLAAAPSAVRANVPGGGTGGARVTLTPEGRNVVLANGIVTATIDPNNAAVLSLKYRGHEMISGGGGIPAFILACPAERLTSSRTIACIRSQSSYLTM